MTIEIHVPDIGADEVEVTEILVKAGDKVAVDQSLLSVEGDKASMEVPASEAGVVKSINVKVGDKVKTGSLIMTFEGEGAAKQEAAPAKEEAKSDAKSEAKADKPKSGGTAVQDVKVPDIGGDAVEVTEIMVKVGDTVSEEQSLLSVEGDKASMEVPAPFAGKV
ncbi:MAG TPA: biotin/lipoyl-containing protein, partial [Rheinheimera sp.]